MSAWAERADRLRLREMLIVEVRRGLLDEFPAVVAGLDEGRAAGIAERALEAALAEGWSARAAMREATALLLFRPAVERDVLERFDVEGGDELARLALANLAALVHLVGNRRVWAVVRAEAEAHGLDVETVPLDELMGLADLRAVFAEGMCRIPAQGREDAAGSERNERDDGPAAADRDRFPTAAELRALRLVFAACRPYALTKRRKARARRPTDNRKRGDDANDEGTA